MKLSKLLERMEYECVQGSVDIPISHLLYDSRNACPDGVFVCISGAVMDGHKVLSPAFFKEAEIKISHVNGNIGDFYTRK